jgi:hypothetical protein
MADIFQVPATLYKVESMSHWWRVIFDTQENIPAEHMAVTLGWLHKLGHLTFAIRQIEADDLLSLPPIKTDDTLTPAQRLRHVLYRLWEKSPEGHKTSETFYLMVMEKLINHYKEKLA